MHKYESNTLVTRMHSSRIRTARTLTVLPCSLLPGGGGGVIRSDQGFGGVTRSDREGVTSVGWGMTSARGWWTYPPPPLKTWHLTPIRSGTYSPQQNRYLPPPPDHVTYLMMHLMSHLPPPPARYAGGKYRILIKSHQKLL